MRRAQPGKAFRRWRSGGAASSLGVHVEYLSVRRLARAFRRDFKLTGWYGIGLFVPPSYVDIPEHRVARLADIDNMAAHLPILRALSDHRLLILTRI
jgi:hypothetical protein